MAAAEVTLRRAKRCASASSGSRPFCALPSAFSTVRMPSTIAFISGGSTERWWSGEPGSVLSTV